MAAIDKMYVHSYYDFEMLRKWALVYYPELIFYFYDFDLTYEEWKRNREFWVGTNMDIARRDYEKITPFSSRAEAEYNLKKHYKKSAGYDCPTEQAIEEATDIIQRYDMKVDEWEEKYTIPVTNTPLSVDKKLLWICPIPFVREYLEKQCGYKTRWYHKLFWRGKKHF